jgi:hypothetical protein
MFIGGKAHVDEYNGANPKREWKMKSMISPKVVKSAFFGNEVSYSPFSSPPALVKETRGDL